MTAGPRTRPERRHDTPAGGDDAEMARDSLAVARWTVVSRASGFVRVAVVAAVLGPTYVGSIFQATNNLPNIAYIALSGSLFSNLLVPPLVRRIDAGDRAGTQRLACAFLSTVLAVFGVVAGVIVLAGPVVLRLLSVGVLDDAAAASQRRIGFVLLVMFMPQLLLYALVGTAEAVMNAHGRFALPAAAPILENVGIIATMAATAWFYGTGDALAAMSTGQLCLLGLGATSAVALHAGVQWWGARQVGVTLVPWRGGRDPEVRTIVRRAMPSLGYSTLDVMQLLAAIIVANRIPGGVVAFMVAYQVYILPSALGARPVAVSLLPRLSRLFQAHDAVRFRDELVRGAALVAFIAVPAAVAFVTLGGPLARALTFGQMATSHGQALTAPAIVSLGPAVVGYSALLLGTYACYARTDAGTPLRAVVLRTVLTIAGLPVAFLVPADGTALLALGLTMSVANVVGGLWLANRLRRVLPPRGESLMRPLLRTVAASALMVVPACVVVSQVPRLLPGPWNGQVAMLTAAATGIAIFLLVHRVLRSPELAALHGGLRASHGWSR